MANDERGLAYEASQAYVQAGQDFICKMLELHQVQNSRIGILELQVRQLAIEINDLQADQHPKLRKEREEHSD